MTEPEKPAPRIRVSTGSLPSEETVREVLNNAYERYRHTNDGVVADYIPALAKAQPNLFGICVIGTRGKAFEIGDTNVAFSIQSISKPFVFALVCEAIGDQSARDLLGVNSTGMKFNSVMAVELNNSRTMNPMVNAGALATTSLVPGTTTEEKWEFISNGLSRFAGRQLEVDYEVYASESATNRRNSGIAHLLDGYRALYGDPGETVDLYTKQCSLLVTTKDIAVMGATLADGGVNPLTKERVVDEVTSKRSLAVMATAGLYEHSGDWLYDCGLPGKSGVGGGIVSIAPGKGGLATYSPLLDPAGNSVRGQLAIKYLSESLGLNLFASKPE